MSPDVQKSNIFRFNVSGFFKMILGIFTSSPKFAVPIERLGKMIGLLCNGSTTDFDSVCLGSNPGNPTKKDKLV